MYNENHHKSFGLGLTAPNEVQNLIVPILEDIYILFYKLLYDLLYIISLCCSRQISKQSVEMFTPVAGKYFT